MVGAESRVVVTGVTWPLGLLTEFIRQQILCGKALVAGASLCFSGHCVVLCLSGFAVVLQSML